MMVHKMTDIAVLIDRLRQYAGRWPEDKPPVFSEVAAHDDLLAAADELERFLANKDSQPCVCVYKDSRLTIRSE